MPRKAVSEAMSWMALFSSAFLGVATVAPSAVHRAFTLEKGIFSRLVTYSFFPDFLPKEKVCTEITKGRWGWFGLEPCPGQQMKKPCSGNLGLSPILHHLWWDPGKKVKASPWQQARDIPSLGQISGKIVPVLVNRGKHARAALPGVGTRVRKRHGYPSETHGCWGRSKDPRVSRPPLHPPPSS